MSHKYSHLAYTETGPADAPVVVLIHGLCHSQSAWEETKKYLEDFRVVTVDLPAHGETPWPDHTTKKSFFPDMLEALGALLDSYEKPIVAGNSLGGYLALELTIRGHARAGLGLNPAGFHFHRLDLILTLVKFGLMKGVAHLLQPLIPRIASTKAGRAVLMRNVSARPSQVPEEVVLRDVQGLIDNQLFTNMPKVDLTFSSVPEGTRLYSLWGTTDRILVKGWRRHHEVLPEAELSLIHDVGHVTMMDEPEHVAERIREMA